MKTTAFLPLFLATFVSAHAADLVGLWEFNDSADPGKATLGSALALTGAISSTTGVSGSDGAASVAVGTYLTATNPIGPNGSSGTPTRTNLYTLVLDFKTPATLPQFSALFDFSLGGDGDYFVRKQSGALELGASTTFGYVGAAGTIGNDTWYRLVLAVDNGAITTSYLNGISKGNHTVNNNLDSATRSISGTFRIFDDPDGNEESLMLVSNLALYDGKLTATEVAALGVAGDPIPLPPTGGSPVLTVQDAVASPIVAKTDTSFSFRATDPDDANVQIQVDWGNGVVSAWTAAAASGSTQQVTYAYPYAGDFTIRAKARNVANETSEWVDIQTLTVTPAPGIPDGLVGLWEFDDPADLGHATYGSDLGIVGSSPTHEEIRADGASASLNGVITTIAGANHLLANHGIGANGYSTRTNTYTIIYDVLVPTAGSWHSLFQTTTANNDDGDYFFRNTDSALGLSAITYSATAPPANRWIRLALTADLADAGFLRTYIDGALFHTHTKPALDSRLSLDPASLLIFGDENGDNQPLAVGMVAMFAKALTAEEVAALGISGTSVITDPNNHAPTIAVQAAGPTTANTGVSQTYSFVPGDADNDPVQVQADWGDGTTTAWTTLAAPGTARTIDHAWANPGTFAVKARSRDSRGGISAWATLQDVVVTGVPQVTFSTPPYLQNMSTTGMVVMAEIVEDVPLKVAYGTTTALGSLVAMTSAASSGGTFFYRSVITGLAPGTTYHYSIAAEDGTPITAHATFRTAPSGREDFSFTAISDCHNVNLGAWDADNFQPGKQMFEHMRTRNIAFCLGVGDQSEGNVYSAVKDGHSSRMAAILGTKVPFYIAWGNHDMAAGPSNQLRLSADMPSRYRADFSPQHGNYAFTYSGVYFLCLDWWELFTDFQGAVDKTPNDLTNGWVQAQLASPEAQAARFRVVSIHIPPFSERWRDGSATMRAQLVPLMEQYHVNLCLSGHTHEYERGVLNGVNYVVTGGGSYMDNGEALVMNWPHMTVGGFHNVPGSFARQSSYGVLGTPQPISGGLFNNYLQITVRGDFMRLDCLGFNADGSYIGILDTFSIGTDPGADTDGDGMRDPWEIANGLDHTIGTGVNGPDGDLDGDGQSNIHEMYAGTTANNHASVFRTTHVTSTGGDLQITWTSVPGKRYTLHTSTDLVTWLPVMNGAVPLVIDASAGATTTHEIPRPGTVSGFVRVGVVRQ